MAVIMMPFIPNTPIGALLSGFLLREGNWRSGCKYHGFLLLACLLMTFADIFFATIIPITLAPQVIMLLLAERQATRLGPIRGLDSNMTEHDRTHALEEEEMSVLGANTNHRGDSSALSPLSSRRDRSLSNAPCTFNCISSTAVD
jgi:hypothetical protein